MEKFGKPAPRIRELTQGFWEGCKQRELRMQQCSDCASFRFPPTAMCGSCNSVRSEWVKVSGRGVVYSFTVPSQPSPGERPARGFEYPYAVALIELPDAGRVRIASNIVDQDAGDIQIGMEVEVHFEDLGEEITLPLFRAISAP